MGIDTLQDWRDALVWAQRAHQADDPFWATDHVLASRAMPVGDSGVVGSMMVEALWESMGPLEHTWLERFVPDCRQKYPLETEWVTPRNAAIAVGHYGLTPLFNYRLLNYVGRFTRAKALPLNPLPFRAWSFKNPSRGARIPR